MIMFILMAGSLFTGVFAATGGMSLMKDLVNAFNLSPWALLFAFLIIIFIAGFFLEWDFNIVDIYSNFHTYNCSLRF